MNISESSANIFQSCYQQGYLDRYRSQKPYALYIHIPFCVQKCNYCDFASWGFNPQSDVRQRYTEALLHRIEELKALDILDELKTCYIGGGTPTVLGEDLLSVTHAISQCSTFDEWTVEANPESLSDYLLDNLYKEGVNRLSIGVQSFNDDELQVLGRIHSSRRVQEVIRRACSLPYQVSLDLMCAFPHQTDVSWEKTLDTALALNPHHISCYPLQIEDETPFGRMLSSGLIDDVDDEVEARRMQRAAERFASSGYERYEVASYARIDGDRDCTSMHNRAYWTGQSYLGVGCSASSMLTAPLYNRLRQAITKLPEISEDTARIRLKITSPVAEFIDAQSLNDLSYELEFLTYPQALAEDMMLGSRMSQGIHPVLIEEAKRVIGRNTVESALQKAVDECLGYTGDDFFKPTHTGWLMGNELYAIFWEQVSQDTEFVSV